MRKFWETKGKRILAFLLAVVVFACAIPNVGVVYAEEAQGTNVIISGTVLVPTDDDENPTAPYADAKVTVKYTATDDSEKTTAEVLTEDNGEYSVEIPDWKLEAGQIAEITIVPAEADVDVYETGTTTVDAGNVTDNAVIAAEVVLAKKETEPTPPPTLVTYTVSVSGGDDKGNTVVIMTADGEKESPLVVEENTAFSVVATPVEGYKITSVVVTNGGTELDHGDNWWSTSGANWTMSEEGIFEYNVASADKDYEVSVTFTEIDKYAVATTVNTAEYGTVEVLYVADASVVEDAGNIYEGEDVKVVARPNEKHEIIGISVQKDDGTGIYVDIPGCDVEGWWSTSGTNWTMGEDGSFTYILEDINAHYSFSVDYAGIPEYSISASVDGDGGDIVINDVNGVEQESGSLALRDEERTIIATPDDGYEIVSVTVKKDDGTGNYVEYIPDGLESDWWSTSGANWTMADGTFTYNISAVETGYEFSVKYAIQEVVVEGIVTYPDKYAEDGVSPYAEADVAIIYDGGKTVNTTTEVDGTYSVVIDDWLIGTDDEYSVVVTIKDGDSVKYTQSERNFSVSSGEAASRQIDREIALALVTYTISWTIDEGGELTLNDENTTYNGTNEIVVSYDDSYKLTVSIVDIYEHMHLDSVMLKQGDAEATEQLTNDDRTAGNDLHEKVIQLANGLTNDLVLTVTVTIDQFDLTVLTEGNGTVTLDSGETFTDNKLVVDYDVSKTLMIRPEEGYQVSSVKMISGTDQEVDVEYAEVVEYSKGKYSYNLNNIKANKTIKVYFEEIPTITYSWENPQFTIERMVDPVSGDMEVYVPEEANPTSFSNEFVIRPNADESTKKLYIGDAQAYVGSVTVSEDTYLNRVYMRDTQFGTEQIIVIPKTITLYADTTAPELASAMQVEFWKVKDATTVTIPVEVTETNLDYVICSEKDNLNAATISKAEGIVAIGEQGALIIQDAPLKEGELKDVYYIYAVDKAGNCSVPKAVTIYRDNTNPEVTATSIPLLGEINKKTYGNFYNNTVTLALTINDIVSEATDNKSSGIAHVVVSIVDGDETIDEQLIQTSGMQTGNDGTYVVNLSYGVNDKFNVLRELTITVVDICNNETVYRLSDLDAAFESDLMMLEDKKPVVTITPDAQAYVNENNGTTEYWYNRETLAAVYSVTDIDARIAKSTVYVNGTAVVEKTYTGTADSTGNFSDVGTELTDITFTSTVLNALQDGVNELKIEFTDLAGNTDFATKTICVDALNPEITQFNLSVERTTLAERLYSWITIGNYSKGNVTITVTGDDVSPSAGLDKISLYLDNEIVAQPVEVDENGEVTFKVPLEDVEGDSEYYYYSKIHAVVTDKVGNISADYEMTSSNSNVTSTDLMIETIKPVLTAEIVEDEENQWTDSEGNVFTNVVGEFKVTASETNNNSGLHSVEILINDEIVEKVVYTGVDKTVATEEKVEYKEFIVPIAENPTDGKYVLTANVIDNAGNESTISSEMYFDATAPTITKFVMTAAKRSGEWNVEEAVPPVFETYYGYYFQVDTKVTVYAHDNSTVEGAEDSGVQRIMWYTKDIDGNETELKTATVDKNGNWYFEIPAGFKGQVYACAYDQLDNHKTDGSQNVAYTSPDGVIIETQEQHDAAEYEHVVFTGPTPEAPYTYGTDKWPLYNKAAFDKAEGKIDYEVTVTDTFSGIEVIEWSITYPENSGKNESGTIKISNNGKFTENEAELTEESLVIDNAQWQITGKEANANLVTEVKGVLSVTGVSNDIKVKVKMIDRSGNTSEVVKQLSIDNVVPTISIDFDQTSPDSQYGNVYRSQRTATITVTENHFKGDNFTISVTNSDGGSPSISSWSSDGERNTATVTFDSDGDYTMEVSGKDMAGNSATSQSVSEFTIDMTVPTVSVSYANDNALNGNYYAATQTATIEVREHNFDAARVNVVGTAGGAASAFPSISAWSSSGDVHTATLTFSADGLYRFDVEVQDQAGNTAESFTGSEFYVDMTTPTIEITGVENMSANNGDVMPRIVLSDTNYNTSGVTITLEGANRGQVSLDGSYSNQGNGQVFTFNNFPKEQEQDDIYTLSVVLNDMAGNETTDEITFSVNRFGSVYVFDDSLKEIAGTYVKEEIDVCLTEVNVDSLEHDTIRIVVDSNGTLKDLVEGTDYTVQENGGNGSWYQYDYVIDKSLFAGDGRYIVTLYSEDTAGNINENIDESKQAEISFGIDKTAPVVIPIDIASDEQYDLDVKTATVTVNDNLVLTGVQIFIGETQVEYTVDGENYVFDIPSASERQQITIVAVDAAGNKTEYLISDVLVTTNAFIRWYNNTPLFVGSILGVTGAGGAGIGLIALRRRRKFKLK